MKIMNDEFYMTLPSDSSMTLFPENKSSSWTTSINPPLTLEGQWTVGLSEIHMPRKWNNVTNSCNKFVINFGDEFQTPVTQIIPKKTIGNAAFVKEVAFDEPSPKYEPLNPAFAIRIEMDFSEDELYTREQYFEKLQSALIAARQKESNNVKFDNNISVAYKKFKVQHHELYMYELKFEHGWSMLYDANDLEPQHSAIARMFGCVPCSFFHPKAMNIRVNKHDNMFGEMPEHKARLKSHRIYVYNTLKIGYNFDDYFIRRKRWMRSTVPVSHLCTISPGAYTSPATLVSAMAAAMPVQALDYLRVSVTEAGYVRFSSFNYRAFFFNFSVDISGLLGRMLGLEYDQLELNYPLDVDTFSMVDGLVHARPEPIYELTKEENSGFGQIGQYTAEYPIDVLQIYGLFVYTDIISPDYVGDVQANLLRVVPVNTDNLIVFNYDDKPHYKPLCMNYITKIRIFIADNRSNEVQFVDPAKTLCKLHFVKRGN